MTKEWEKLNKKKKENKELLGYFDDKDYWTEIYGEDEEQDDNAEV